MLCSVAFYYRSNFEDFQKMECLLVKASFSAFVDWQTQRERLRERETKRETERQRERETEKSKNKQRERQRQR